MTAPTRAIAGRVQRNSAGTTVVERRGISNVTTWLNPDDYRALDAYARKVGMSKASLVRHIIQKYLAEYGGGV